MSAPKILPVAGALLLAALLLAAVPTARAGAVFEIREAIPANSADLKFVFDSPGTVFTGAGAIQRSATTGAGSFFKESAIPLALFTLNQCTAVAPHIHPNSAETLFVLEGAIRVFQFRGEEDGTKVHVTYATKWQAVYIMQGAYHLVENVNKGTTKFLQIFDHPFGGAVFAAPALAALPRYIVNSAFSAPILAAGTTGKTAAIINVTPANCPWW